MINTARKYRLRRLAVLLIMVVLVAVITLVVNLIYGFIRQEESADSIPEPTMPPVSVLRVLMLPI